MARHTTRHKSALARKFNDSLKARLKDPTNIRILRRLFDGFQMEREQLEGQEGMRQKGW
jgi:hypothetical protein